MNATPTIEGIAPMGPDRSVGASIGVFGPGGHGGRA